VFGFRNLAEIILGENYCILLLRCVESGVTNIEEISAQGKVRSMFLKNSERKETNSLRPLNALTKISGSEFFPMH
jgi:hypothetical protein